jgi:hypothetical protein
MRILIISVLDILAEIYNPNEYLLSLFLLTQNTNKVLDADLHSLSQGDSKAHFGIVML